MDPARTERLALCDLLAGLGPNAPTLLPGWTTVEVAAHLLARGVLPLFGPLLARRVGANVVLVSEDGRRRRVRRGAAVVEVHGRPSALLLALFGRRQVAVVHAIGDPEAVDAWEQATLGP